MFNSLFNFEDSILEIGNLKIVEKFSIKSLHKILVKKFFGWKISTFLKLIELVSNLPWYYVSNYSP